MSRLELLRSAAATATEAHVRARTVARAAENAAAEARTAWRVADTLSHDTSIVSIAMLEATKGADAVFIHFALPPSNLSRHSPACRCWRLKVSRTSSSEK